MGKASRQKWEKRVENYEGIVVSQDPSRAGKYLRRIKKSGKFMSVAGEMMIRAEKEEGEAGHASQDQST